MPLLKWASSVLNSTSDAEREQMQDKFDTAFWTLSANHKLQADTEITLMAIASKAVNAIPRYAFAHCENGKWTADLR